MSTPLESDPNSPLREGDILASRYRILGTLGVGGTGTVVKAEHVEHGHPVAIRFVRPEILPTREAVARLENEVRSAARLRNPHLVRIHDVGRLIRIQLYIVTELLEGANLLTLLKKDHPLPVSNVVDHVLHACEGLATAHAHDLVHRHVKPSNLFLVRVNPPSVKLADLGLHGLIHAPTEGEAKSLAATLDMGDPTYMAPEELRDPDIIDPRTDIWAMGVTLYELLGGRTPHEAENLPELRRKISEDPAPPLRSLRADVPEGLEAVVQRCLAIDPSERIPDITALAMDLAPFASAVGKTSVERITWGADDEVSTDVNAELEPIAASPEEFDDTTEVMDPESCESLVSQTIAPASDEKAQKDSQPGPPEGKHSEPEPEGKDSEPEPEGKDSEPEPEGKDSEPEPPEGKDSEPEPPEGKSRDDDMTFDFEKTDADEPDDTTALVDSVIPGPTETEDDDEDDVTTLFDGKKREAALAALARRKSGEGEGRKAGTSATEQKGHGLGEAEEDEDDVTVMYDGSAKRDAGEQASTTKPPAAGAKEDEKEGGANDEEEEDMTLFYVSHEGPGEEGDEEEDKTRVAPTKLTAHGQPTSRKGFPVWVSVSIGVAGAFIVIGLITLVLVLRAARNRADVQPPEPPPSTSGEEPVSIGTFHPGTEESETEGPGDTDPDASDVVFEEVPPRIGPVNGLMPPVSASAGAPASASASSRPKLDCNPPYTLDKQGVRIPKPHCL